MKCKEILQRIEEVYPADYAMEWDNVGLLAGRYEKEVKRIYVALDATEEVIEAAIRKGADLLVTHHPMIFAPQKKITDAEFIGNRLIRLIRNDIAYYAMHTNYDVLRMSELSAKYLGLSGASVLEVTRDGEHKEGIGRVADLNDPLDLRACCEKVKDAFGLTHVQVFGELSGTVKRLAISPGSGKSMIGPALASGADVLVTGDIGHHEGIDAAAQGLTVIDAGHYGIEHIFIEDMREFLEKRLEGVSVTADPPRDPFLIV